MDAYDDDYHGGWDRKVIIIIVLQFGCHHRFLNSISSTCLIQKKAFLSWHEKKMCEKSIFGVRMLHQ